jgi:hypothetical protein
VLARLCLLCRGWRNCSRSRLMHFPTRDSDLGISRLNMLVIHDGIRPVCACACVSS